MSGHAREAKIKQTGKTWQNPVNATNSPVGVIDIGSNSVRLVVYDGLRRTPIPLFNEKVFCGLGKSVAANGRIEGKAAESTLATVKRFSALLRQMQVENIHAVATAAAREAENGAEFIAELSRATGLKIRIISGEEEGRLSAQGVLAGNPWANGLAGDLGGASIELIAIANGAQGRTETLPLGPLKLQLTSDVSASQMERVVDGYLSKQKWIGEFTGATFYAVGGSWRALAQAHMRSVRHPVNVIHEYEIAAPEALKFTDEIVHKTIAELIATPGLSKRRAETAAPAAVVLNRLLQHTQVRRVVFSAYGLREGILFTHLAKALQARDPLIAACEEKSARLGRFPDHADEITGWTNSLFENESDGARRIRHCASLLSDIGWRVHPDHRANQCLLEVVNSPFVGINHMSRVLLALTIYYRYRTEPAEGIVGDLVAYAGDAAKSALVLGLALRLGHTISGGAAGVLTDCLLQAKNGVLSLRIPKRHASLDGEILRKRLRRLAVVMGCEHQVIIDPA